MKTKRLLTIVMAFAIVQPAIADVSRSFSILKYNTPGTSFIKAGLGAWPMVMDYDGDGDLDIVVRSYGVPARHHGTWLFENTGKPGDLHPFFKPARRLGDEGCASMGSDPMDAHGVSRILEQHPPPRYPRCHVVERVAIVELDPSCPCHGWSPFRFRRGDSPHRHALENHGSGC